MTAHLPTAPAADAQKRNLCAFPGCKAKLRYHAPSGVCALHLHLAPHCQCRFCLRRRHASSGAPERVNRDDLAVVQAARKVEPDPATCRELWQSVMLQMVLSAFPHGIGYGYAPAHRAERFAALAWFGTQEFAAVASLAGLDPGYIMRGLGPALTAARAEMTATIAQDAARRKKGRLT